MDSSLAYEVHTNRREYTGRARGPVQFEDVTQMTDEQIAQELNQLLAQRGLALVPIDQLDGIQKEQVL